MAELTFVGAAGTVTGSKHLVSIGQRHFFVDCGLFQGAREIEALNHAPLPIAPKSIDAVVITHGHLDHVGYLPKLVRDGFHGPIYCTPATADVIEIVLEDAAHLQHHMHERGFRHERSHGLAPLFDEADVKNALGLRKAIPYEKEFFVCGVSVRYRPVGHIIGAAYADTTIEGRRVIFSGDVGRYESALLNDPTPLDTADVVVCEATYGDREHPPDSLEALHSTLIDGIRRGGPIVIPTFAVERAQDLLYALGRLQRKDSAIAQLPVHLDSPMAIKIDAIFARHRDAYKTLPDTAAGPFGCRNLSMHVTSDESKALNAIDTPAIIVASSGMATGGRILYHLHRNLPNPAATIVFPGFQVPGTLGRLLIDGVSPIRIFGDSLNVKAHIVHLSAFSAHADQSELLRWLGTLQSKQARIYLVHTEPRVASIFAAVLKERLGLTATLAERGLTVTL